MKYLIALLCVLLLFSCKKGVQRINEITKIELARSGAWSDYGGAIGVDSSLNYKYYDGNSKKNFIGKINKRFWDSINRRFERIKFKEIPVSDDNNIIEDATYFELIIHWKDSSRRITRVRGIKPDSVVKAFIWLNDIYKNIILHQISRLIKFETTFQNPPPQPKIEQIKFPPPIKQ